MNHDPPTSERPSAQRARSRSWILWACGGLLLVGLPAVWWLWPDRTPESAAGTERESEEEPAAWPANPGYVGPQACVKCHAERVAEFQATGHFRTSRLPRAEEMPPGFGFAEGTHVTRDRDLRFEMTRQGDEFIQTAVRRTPVGEQRTSAAIGLAYGAGGADEVYHHWRDGCLFRLPLAWLHPLKRWGNAPGFRDGTAEFFRETTPRCLECHTTWFAHAPGTPNRYDRRHFIAGVTCERCHGPGREHVRFHEAQPEAKTAVAVVHPAKLPRERQLDLCAQCHSNADKHRGPAFAYRPGEPLAAYYRTDIGKHPEDDHVANQSKYLRQSKCFQKSDMTCTTCHDPHRPATASPAASGAASCSKCHADGACHEGPRLPAGARNECVGCHMPPRNVINIYFHTDAEDFVPLIRRHEHRIAVYPVARQEVLLGWHRRQDNEASKAEVIRITDSLTRHWLDEAAKLRRQHRFLAAIGALREAERLSPTAEVREALRETIAIQTGLESDMERAQRWIDEKRFVEAIELLKKILHVKPDLAVAHGKLGTCYAVVGKNDLAVEHLEAVARHDPNSAYGLMMLGWLAYLRGDAGEATAFYRRAEEIEPYSAKLNHHAGLALVRQERWEQAERRFRRVLEIDPKHVEGHVALSQTLRRQGKPAEALPFAERAARLSKFQKADVLLNLADALADNGRFGDAARYAARALEACADAPLEALIRRRLEDYQARNGRDAK